MPAKPQQACESTPIPADISVEKHCTPVELGKLWHVAHHTIRRLFQSECGVLLFGTPESRTRKGRMQMRIPASVAARVHRRLRGQKVAA